MTWFIEMCKRILLSLEDVHRIFHFCLFSRNRVIWAAKQESSQSGFARFTIGHFPSSFQSIIYVHSENLALYIYIYRFTGYFKSFLSFLHLPRHNHYGNYFPLKMNFSTFSLCREALGSQSCASCKMCLAIRLFCWTRRVFFLESRVSIFFLAPGHPHFSGKELPNWNKLILDGEIFHSEEHFLRTFLGVFGECF